MQASLQKYNQNPDSWHRKGIATGHKLTKPGQVSKGN